MSRAIRHSLEIEDKTKYASLDPTLRRMAIPATTTCTSPDEDIAVPQPDPPMGNMGKLELLNKPISQE